VRPLNFQLDDNPQHLASEFAERRVVRAKLDSLLQTLERGTKHFYDIGGMMLQNNAVQFDADPEPR